VWTFRPARPGEAEAICTVLRRSIEDLCRAGHGGNPAVLGPWLANKTPEYVTAWIDANPTGFIVGVGPDGIDAVGLVTANGEIWLNYVAPWARFQGITKGLLRAMENHAAECGAAACTQISTKTAHRFYQGCGYEDTGAQVPSYGGTLAFPMRRRIG
jgi:GNAT superfamily N-acetyltransferase